MLSIITIINRLKVPQGTGSIFEQITLKNLHLQKRKSRFVNPHLKAIAFSFFCPCGTFFRLVFSFRQAEQTKNGVKLLDLDQQLYQPNRPEVEGKNSELEVFIEKKLEKRDQLLLENIRDMQAQNQKQKRKGFFGLFKK